MPNQGAFKEEEMEGVKREKKERKGVEEDLGDAGVVGEGELLQPGELGEGGHLGQLLQLDRGVTSMFSKSSMERHS